MSKQPEARVGDFIIGTCVTFGSQKTGRVAEVVGPITSPDCGGYRYKLTGTGMSYSDGKPVEPIVFYACHAMSEADPHAWTHRGTSRCPA